MGHLAHSCPFGYMQASAAVLLYIVILALMIKLQAEAHAGVLRPNLSGKKASPLERAVCGKNVSQSGEWEKSTPI